MDDENYRIEKLQFVSNLKGSTIDRIINTMIIVPLIYLLSLLIKILLTSNDNKQKFWFSFLIDYIFCLIPLIGVSTLLESSTHILIYLFMFISSILYLIINKKIPDVKIESKNDTIDLKIIKLGISSFRLWLYALTTVSILAVDFKIFPRHLAKTETYGMSIMDLGVGMYIAAHSMKMIRNDQIEQRVKSNIFTKIFKELKSSSILLLIGCLRLFSIKSTNYIEHVSEYGVHWNFLFTIVVVKLLATLMQPFIGQSSFKCFLIAGLIAFYYQYFLSAKNYTQYLLSDERNFSNYIDMNKEGIFSCVGYLAIYLIFQAIFLHLGQILNTQEETKKFRKSLKCVLNLILIDVCFWFLFQYSSSNIQAPSRRLCNLSFILLSAFCATFLLTLFTIVVLFVVKFLDRKYSTSEKLNLLIDNIFSFAKIVDSKFVGLIVFLVSNVLTGLVNLSIKTLYAADSISMLILCAYTLVSFFLPFTFYTFLNHKKDKIM